MQNEQTENGEHQQADERAGISTATAGEKNTDIADAGCISDEQFSPGRKTTPADQTCAENSQHLKHAGEMIRANIKSARSSAVINPLQKLNRHKILAVAKLDRTDEGVNEGKCEKSNHDPGPLFCRCANQRDEPVNNQPAEHRVNVRTYGVDDRRKKCANQ